MFQSKGRGNLEVHRTTELLHSCVIHGNQATHKCFTAPRDRSSGPLKFRNGVPLFPNCPQLGVPKVPNWPPIGGPEMPQLAPQLGVPKGPNWAQLGVPKAPKGGPHPPPGGPKGPQKPILGVPEPKKPFFVIPPLGKQLFGPVSSRVSRQKWTFRLRGHFWGSQGPPDPLLGPPRAPNRSATGLIDQLPA